MRRPTLRALPETIKTALGGVLYRVRSAGLAGAAMLVVAMAAVLVAVLPVPGTSCPASLGSLVSRATSSPAAKTPAADAAKAAAETEAISQAQAAVDGGSDRVKTAQAAADSVREASDTATSDDADSSDVDDAQWNVDDAQNSVDADHDLLDLDNQGSYDSADDEATLAQDQKTLAAAKTALKTAKKAAATAQAKAEVKARAQAKAQQDLDTANSDQVDLEATLSSAQNAKIADDASQAVVLALWSHTRREAVDTVTARNTLRSSCRRTAGSTLAVSGMLALVAVLLAAGNILAGRRTGSRPF